MNENITNFFSFPELINEVAARLVAIGVLVLSSVVLFLLIFNELNSLPQQFKNK